MVVGVVLAMAGLITVGACCGYFYGSWVQKCEPTAALIKLHGRNTELKAKIDHLNVLLVENKKNLDFYQFGFERLEGLITRTAAGLDRRHLAATSGERS